MKHFISLKLSMALLTGITLSTSLLAVESLPVDNFDDPNTTTVGYPRLIMDDSVAGGQSQASHSINAGTFKMDGKIAPPRGQIGWVSTVLPLIEAGGAFDAGKYDGVKIRVKVRQGNLSLSANSNNVTNFDYHAATVVATNDGNFHEVTIPFNQMKRAWSEQTRLDPSTLNSLSIVAYGFEKGEFNYEIDDIRFYQSDIE